MYINTFKYTPKDVSCQLCTEYVKKLGCTALRCPWLAERIEADVRRAYGRGLGVFFLLVEGITVLQFQLLGIFLFHLQGSDVVGNVVSTQRQYAEVAQDIVLIDQHGGGVGTEVHQCTARTHLVFGDYPTK